jgi:hypothetical protein
MGPIRGDGTRLRPRYYDTEEAKWGGFPPEFGLTICPEEEKKPQFPWANNLDAIVGTAGWPIFDMPFVSTFPKKGLQNFDLLVDRYEDEPAYHEIVNKISELGTDLDEVEIEPFVAYILDRGTQMLKWYAIIESQDHFAWNHRISVETESAGGIAQVSEIFFSQLMNNPFMWIATKMSNELWGKPVECYGSVFKGRDCPGKKVSFYNVPDLTGEGPDLDLAVELNQKQMNILGRVMHFCIEAAIDEKRLESGQAGNSSPSMSSSPSILEDFDVRILQTRAESNTHVVESMADMDEATGEKPAATEEKAEAAKEKAEQRAATDACSQSKTDRGDLEVRPSYRDGIGVFRKSSPGANGTMPPRTILTLYSSAKEPVEPEYTVYDGRLIVTPDGAYLVDQSADELVPNPAVEMADRLGIDPDSPSSISMQLGEGRRTLTPEVMNQIKEIVGGEEGAHEVIVPAINEMFCIVKDYANIGRSKEIPRIIKRLYDQLLDGGLNLNEYEIAELKKSAWRTISQLMRELPLDGSKFKQSHRGIDSLVNHHRLLNFVDPEIAGLISRPSYYQDGYEITEGILRAQLFWDELRFSVNDEKYRFDGLDRRIEVLRDHAVRYAAGDIFFMMLDEAREKRSYPKNITQLYSLIAVAHEIAVKTVLVDKKWAAPIDTRRILSQAEGCQDPRKSNCRFDPEKALKIFDNIKSQLKGQYPIFDYWWNRVSLEVPYQVRRKKAREVEVTVAPNSAIKAVLQGIDFKFFRLIN